MVISMSTPARRPDGLLHFRARRFQAIAAQPVDRSPPTQIQPSCAPTDHDGRVFLSYLEQPVRPRVQFASIPPAPLASPPDTRCGAPQSKPALLPAPTRPARMPLPSFPANPSRAKSGSTQESSKPPQVQSPRSPASTRYAPILRAQA